MGVEGEPWAPTEDQGDRVGGGLTGGLSEGPGGAEGGTECVPAVGLGVLRKVGTLVEVEMPESGRMRRGPGASLGSQQDRVRSDRRPWRKGVQRDSREGGWCVWVPWLRTGVPLARATSGHSQGLCGEWDGRASAPSTVSQKLVRGTVWAWHGGALWELRAAGASDPWFLGWVMEQGPQSWWGACPAPCTPRIEAR